MSVQIAIAIVTPVVTAQKFSDMTGMPLATVKKKIQLGAIPTMKRHSKAGKSSRETPLINLTAMTLEGATHGGNSILFSNQSDK